MLRALHALRRFRSRRLHAQSGFTLIELIISISIGALVIAVIASVLVTVARAESQTGQRFSESADAQIASAYLANDAQSIETITTNHCAGSGDVLFSILRDDAKRVTYRQIVADGELIRVVCDGASSGSTTLATELAATAIPTSTICDGGSCADGSQPFVLQLHLTQRNTTDDGTSVSEGLEYTLTGSRRTTDADPDPPAYDFPPFLALGGGGTRLLSLIGGARLNVNGDIVVDFDPADFTASQLNSIVRNNANGTNSATGTPAGLYAQNGGRFLIKSPGKCSGCSSSNTNPHPWTAFNDDVVNPFDELDPPECDDYPNDYTGSDLQGPGCYHDTLVLRHGGPNGCNPCNLPAGDYFLEDGLEVQGNINVNGNGVFFYNESGQIDFGAGTISFTNANDDWGNLFLWQPAGNTETIALSGGGSLTSDGGVYAPDSTEGLKLSSGAPQAFLQQVVGTNITLEGGGAVWVGY